MRNSRGKFYKKELVYNHLKEKDNLTKKEEKILRSILQS